MRAAGDADGFVVDLQADWTGELVLDAVGCRRAWATAGLLLMKLGARRGKAPKHRHHGAEDDLQFSTNGSDNGRGSCQDVISVVS